MEFLQVKRKFRLAELLLASKTMPDGAGSRVNLLLPKEKGTVRWSIEHMVVVHESPFQRCKTSVSAPGVRQLCPGSRNNAM